MLKKILATLDGLDEALHSFYKKAADGKYHLQLEDDDAEPLRRAKEHEKGLREIAERERDEARQELETATSRITELEGSQQTGVQELRETLTLEHNTRVEKMRNDHAREKEALEKSVKKVFVSDVANRLAREIAVEGDEGAVEILSDLMSRRLSVEIVNGEPKTRVLQADGQASSMSPDELREEYFTNEKYARIMRASGASGGGATGGSNGRDGVPKKLADMGDAERIEWYQRDPEGFERARAAGN